MGEIRSSASCGDGTTPAHDSKARGGRSGNQCPRRLRSFEMLEGGSLIFGRKLPSRYKRRASLNRQH